MRLMSEIRLYNHDNVWCYATQQHYNYVLKDCIQSKL